jgi:hypothetical protein
VKWDPKVLRLNEITPGELLARDGQQVTSAKDIRNDTGEAWVTMNRLPGAGGVEWSGRFGDVLLHCHRQGQYQGYGYGVRIEECSVAADCCDRSGMDITVQ